MLGYLEQTAALQREQFQLRPTFWGGNGLREGTDRRRGEQPDDQ